MPERSRPAPAGTRSEPAPGWPRRAVALLVLVVAVLVTHAWIGERGLSSVFATWRAHERLTEQLAALRVENARLRAAARRLRGDLGAIEAVARRELGLIRPGETVFLLRDAPPVPPAGAPPVPPLGAPGAGGAVDDLAARWYD